MLTNNFKNIIIQSSRIYYTANGGSYYVQSTVSSLYLVNMNNVKVNLSDDIICHWSFFFGGSDTSGLRMIRDYDNLEDMIASRVFFTGGTRSETITISQSNGNNAGAGMIILGSGDTPPTPDDYKLDDWIPTTELYAVSYGVILPNTREDDLIGGFTATYYNVSQENKIIKEIGVISHGSLNNNKNYGTKILMAREVFENPIIIKPQEGYTFSFLIK